MLSKPYPTNFVVAKVEFLGTQWRVLEEIAE
jgi:hypothetical protein